MRTYILDRSQLVPRPLDEVFGFFADAGNLERLTPPWLSFHILTPRPIAMGVGTLIDYRIRVKGIPMRWRSRITLWDPPHAFADEQIKGPYSMWYHEHRFEAVDGGTRCTDRVEYALPLGPLGRLMHRLMVKRDVEKIFEFRRCELERIFS